MYLKSIEVHGFKSFANKIVFDFHNGITGIVGPNGSGKSNVADAVRWVLGEQSAKQLRGASMQDIIFAGTENRKPLSYAYVAITLDNADHKLPVDFEEVTVARRVYRSGESEYLLNGTPCRLKDVNELFYDTGIGKEGYSIIGQGQIERILNGKPEERRELFDEAAGIVKFKRRKATAQKKLEDERENLLRVNDILSELERQVAPLEKQANTAKIYLQKKEELKTYDVNMFLLEVERIEKEQSEVQKKYRIADDELKEANASYESTKAEYENLERAMESIEEEINATKDKLNNTSVTRGKLEGQINVLKEQIHTAELTEEHLQSRLAVIEKEKNEKKNQNAEYVRQEEKIRAGIAEISEKRTKAEAELEEIQTAIAKCKESMENGKNEIITLLNNKASIQANRERYDTMLEQINIRKAELTKRLLQRKSEEADSEKLLLECKNAYKEACDAIEAVKSSIQEMEEKERDWGRKKKEVTEQLEGIRIQYHKEQSRLESLKNIAERYDGYGNSIRKVMEQKEKEKGIIGVVADLIKVDKKYETAIEIALSGNIQNIVTEDESTAKRMIGFLKQNRLGRATFLPLTSVKGKDNSKNEKYLKEEGILGFANKLVEADARYEGIMSYLLGRVLVADTIDHALSLAKKSQYSLHIVTLEGEYLSPGGSMAGGAFKNSSNLLGRKREIEDLEKKLSQLVAEIKVDRVRMEEIKTAEALLVSDKEAEKLKLQELFLKKNTAELNLKQEEEKQKESETVYAGLKRENEEIERQILEINSNKEQILTEIEAATKREEEIKTETEKLQNVLNEQAQIEDVAAKKVSEIQLEEANYNQQAEFVIENTKRITAELKKLDEEVLEVQAQMKEATADVEKKTNDIKEIEKTILASDDSHVDLENYLKDCQKKKEEMSTEYKGFFQKREDISKHISELDKEVFRLNSQREKLEEALEYQNNYMWEEYELTLHHAMTLRKKEDTSLPELKKKITTIKEEIRKLGDVNVNAIEDYKEILGRYEFLKGQHDDLIEAEKTLLGIIDDLDTGMRKQFTEKFAEIQHEFDKAFKELFGGGKGTLELVEGEDILECGIRIIAQPPGKKLQNMMQLSGGEKSLTAIALLFAIQNLKPSPFCLLDEIEAALDDSNVDRFAKYLHKLTKNTQFIVITHRRGTMNAADRLYGITMQEKGVSTLVSVNLIESDLDA
ncbi:chromosome segregation protein SMC [Roseburia hominis]|uniref:chromosome segregation protein SMC n=1 Tax=Roseburia hominis TaxID=301301 RepID=UPI001F431F16|nr:chromosome segregation protein SMC [Roseburia hominis]